MTRSSGCKGCTTRWRGGIKGSQQDHFISQAACISPSSSRLSLVHLYKVSHIHSNQCGQIVSPRLRRILLHNRTTGLPPPHHRVQHHLVQRLRLSASAQCIAIPGRSREYTLHWKQSVDEFTSLHLWKSSSPIAWASRQGRRRRRLSQMQVMCSLFWRTT